MPTTTTTPSHRDPRFESGRAQYAESSSVVLQDIVMKSGGGKVDLKFLSQH